MKGYRLACMGFCKAASFGLPTRKLYDTRLIYISEECDSAHTLFARSFFCKVFVLLDKC